MLIPGNNILVTYWPINTNTLQTVGLEILRTQAIGLPAPHNRAPGRVITPQPVISSSCRFFVGMFVIFYPEMFGRLLDCIGNTTILFGIMIGNFLLGNTVKIWLF